MLKRINKWEKSVKKSFLQRQFYTLYEQKFSNMRPLLFITFPNDSENSKSLDIGVWEVGAKRPLTLKLPGEGQMALPLNLNDKNIPNADFFLVF